MDFNNLSFGYSGKGTQNYLEELNAQAIEETCKKLADMQKIKAAFDAGWQGQARDNFVKNFEKAVEKAQGKIRELKKKLDKEFETIRSDVMKADREIVQLDK